MKTSRPGLAPRGSALRSITALAAVAALASTARAEEKRVAFVPGTPAPQSVPAPPSFATHSLISLNRQRMWVYDDKGFVTTTRVSTGTAGYNTPRGIYSVIGKKEDHASNLYEGAPMPHMQRLLWSGIALHGGEVPRYPASHGCVRLPWDFAEKFFGMTTLNHRVIIVPDVQAPVKVSHQHLFTAMPDDSIRFASTGNAEILGPHVSSDTFAGMRSRADIDAERMSRKDRIVAADLFAKEELRHAKYAEPLAVAAVTAAKDQLKAARLALIKPLEKATKTSRINQDAQKRLAAWSKKIATKALKVRADDLIEMREDEAALRARAMRFAEESAAASAVAQAARNAVATAEKQLADAMAAAKTAKERLDMSTQNEAAAFRALEDFELAERNRVKPVSVMVSSKTGLVSVRQGFEPIAEGQAIIADAGRPLGTYVFTATNWSDTTSTKLDWTVIGVNEKGLWDTQRSTNAEETKLPPPTDSLKAKAALDRITLPPEILEVIAEVVKPGSSLIISDYDMARSETGKGTDFIVQMPEVIAKYRTPQDIAKAKAKARGLIASTGQSRIPWYYAPDGIGRVRYNPAPGYRPRPVRYSPPPKIAYKFVQKQKYRPSRSFFEYGNPY